MIKNSYCKINLNLRLLARRADGYTEIRTVMYPLRGIHDMVELVPCDEFRFSSSGIVVDCEPADNLCVKAYELMRGEYLLPPVKLHLHKNIPFGAGLGAGSANAAAVVELCNERFELGLSVGRMRELCALLGSDTPFFVDARPSVASGRGEILEPIDVDLAGYYICMVKPSVGVSTREAYAIVVPYQGGTGVDMAIQRPVEQWREWCVNDFEAPIFERLPVLSLIKDELYRAGALFALMSGSGSTIYGIFAERPNLSFDHFFHIEKL